MGFKRVLGTVATVLLVLAVAAMLLGGMLGQPFLFGYVSSESMEPTMAPGDGFVAVPSTVAGSVEEGDVVVFHAEELHGGGLTTHRVMGTTDEGYVTAGDKNPFTDQSAGEPPVTDEQIVAQALEINGQVVVIPHLGTLVTGLQDGFDMVRYWLAAFTGVGIFAGPQGLGAFIFIVTVSLYITDTIRERGRRQYERTRNRNTGINTRLVIGAFTVLLVISATASMVGSSGVNDFGIVSAAYEDDRPSIVPRGESKNNTLRVSNGGFVPKVVFYEPGEMTDVQSREVFVPARSQANVTATFTAPPATGGYRRYIVEYHYLAILPIQVIQTLYHIHPWTPIVVIDALIGIPFYLLGVRLVGTGRIRDQSRSRNLPFMARLRRIFRGLY
jgi:signal peptidase